MTGIQRLRAFFRSPHHAWLALLTLGAGAAAASIPGVIAGAAAYALGWVFLPDSRWFKAWVSSREERQRSGRAHRDSEAFLERRAEIYRQLTKQNQRAYDELAASADAIRLRFAKGGSDGNADDIGARHNGRLGQLAWTYLRLLLTEQTLGEFLRTESTAEIDKQLEALVTESRDMEQRVHAFEEAGKPTEAAGLQRLLQSKESRIDSLRRRREHVSKAEGDLVLTRAEIDRILDAVRLIEADFVARGDPERLASEIDRTTSHFGQTQDWLRDLEFDHTPSDVPDDVTAVAPMRVTVTE